MRTIHYTCILGLKEISVPISRYLPADCFEIGTQEHGEHFSGNSIFPVNRLRHGTAIKIAYLDAFDGLSNVAHGLLIKRPMTDGVFRLAAMADLHYGSDSRGKYSSVFSQIGETADALLLCGDLVDYGAPEEAHILVRDLESLARRIPIIAVLGNHEFESGRPDEVGEILTGGGVKVLDGDSCEIQGIGFAGVKGFAGGFDDRKLQPWGEEVVKAFVREAGSEAMKLELALSELRSSQRIALLHYSPVSSTVVGESPEIFPFLGSSRLEEPLNRYPVTAVFHGHAHHGTVEGKTKSGTPVYNVAVKLLEQVFPKRPPYRTLELPRVYESS